MAVDHRVHHRQSRSVRSQTVIFLAEDSRRFSPKALWFRGATLQGLTAF